MSTRNDLQAQNPAAFKSANNQEAEENYISLMLFW